MTQAITRITSTTRERSQGPATVSLAAAVCLALYGAPPAARADSASNADSSSELQEITVTATRRKETVEAVPYSISVVSPEQIAASGAVDIPSLAVQVPGLAMFDYGARFIGAVTPIIRGINATGSPARSFRSFEQAPVGMYVDNSPVAGYFQLEDLNRIEVLRGPQGTLYGAGALGGALRIIPNAPELNTWAGSVEVGGSRIDHSDGTGWTLKSVLNMPIGDQLAIRAWARIAYEPGWILDYGPEVRTNQGSLYGTPVLADPSDPVHSSPIYTSRNDWNWQRTSTERAALLWKPNEAFSAEAAILHSHVAGDGGPLVNPTYAGGVSPIDPNAVFPAGGHYTDFSLIDQPYYRTTNLSSLDLSYDSGFATVASTTSYYTTSGMTMQDSTYDYAGYAGGAYLPYYAGVPTNPRFIYPFQFTDEVQTFSQEVRLVSKADPSNRFDYVVGAFYENTTSHGDWFVTNPGSPQYAVAQGCTGYPSSGPPAYPNCLLISGPNDLTFEQLDKQQFQDRSVFGEVTYHVTPHIQVTAGARHYSQSFTDAQLYDDFAFYSKVPPIPYNSPASKTVGKANVSLEFADRQYVYALWSQGFRRGGANSVPASGPFQESPLLRNYQPDSTDNYETGVKGRLANGLYYAFTGFWINWNHPQISGSLPSGNLAVYNANTARSRGFEFESSGPLLAHGLSYLVGFTYVDATLASDFSLPANNGLGVITPGLLHGESGEQLPGSPKTSVNAALMYDFTLVPAYEASLSVNGVYRSAEALQVAPSVGSLTVQHSSSYTVMNLSATVTHKPWHATCSVTNVLNRQEILAPPSQPNQVDNLTNEYIVNPPREIGLRIGYSF